MFKNRISRLVVVLSLGTAVCFIAGGALQAAQQDPAKPQEQKPAQPPKSPEKMTPVQQIRSQLGDGQDEQIKIGTDLVSLTVTVTDPYNRLVTGLDKQHFEIFEDKVKQEIRFFNDTDSPVSLGIIFDVSGRQNGNLDRGG